MEELLISAGYNVKKLQMSIDASTGQNPSYCFVDFDSEEAATRALQDLSGLPLHGRPIKVRPAVNSKPHYGQTRITSSGYGSAQGTSRADLSTNWRERVPQLSPSSLAGPSSILAGPSQTSVEQSPANAGSLSSNAGPYPRDHYAQRREASGHWRDDATAGRRLWVGSLPRIEPQTVAETTVRALFSNHCVVAVSKLIWPREADPSLQIDQCYCFVDFVSADDAEGARCAYDGAKTPWGGRVRVKQAKGDSTRVLREQFGEKEVAGYNDMASK